MNNITILGWPIGQIDEAWAGIQHTVTALQYWDLEQGSKLELRCANLNLNANTADLGPLLMR